MKLNLIPLLLVCFVTSTFAQAPVLRIAATAVDDVLEAAAKVSGRTLPAEARVIAIRELNEAHFVMVLKLWLLPVMVVLS